MLISIEQLEAQTTTAIAKENADRDVILAFSEMTTETESFSTFHSALIQWAAKLFPDNYPVYTITFNPPEVCSDGQVRTELFDYLDYIADPKTISDHMAAIDEQLAGMKLSYNYTDKTITFYVRKG
jgi:hypothetical protein